MMKRGCKQTGVGCLVLVAVLLTACGGGSGSTSPGAANVRPPAPDDVGVPDPARARTYFTGSTAPDLTEGQVRDQVRQRLGNIQGGSPDGSLRLSDISLFTTRDELGLPERVDATCSATTCRYDLQGITSVSVDVDVEDVSVNSFLSADSSSIRPIMRYREIPLVEVKGSLPESEGSADVFSYGGWLDYSVFLAGGGTATSGSARDVSLYFGLSTGIASNSRPTGSASWNGVMVATDVSGAGRENIIQGDAALSIDLDATTLDLSFSNVRDLTTGATRPGTTWSNMPVTAAGEFSGRNAQGETAGRFYGPVHEEAGGTFTYDDLAGAYGLKRQ